MLKGPSLFCLVATAGILAAQTSPEAQPGGQSETLAAPAAAQTPAPNGLKRRDETPAPGAFQIDAGTRVLLNVVKSVSTKHAVVGDRVYLETAFPVNAGNRIVVPQGSWVTGTITELKRPGRGKGRGEMQLRFDSLVLLNGVTRNFRGDLAGLDASTDGTLKREGSKIEGPGDKKSDVGTVIGTTAAGAGIGTGIGAAAGHIRGGSLIGLGAGAAAGIITVLLTRGPDATLLRGSSVEMVLDRALTFSAADLDFSNAPPRGTLAGSGPTPSQQNNGWTPRAPF
jgi:type IV secretion system protein VirB10